MKFFRLFIITIIKPLWYLASFLIPKNDKYLAINTLPDFDDSVRSFLVHNNYCDLVTIILTLHRNPKIPSWVNGINIIIAYRYSPLGIWLYHRSKYVFFTHGLFSFWTTTSRQKIVNIWHGMPIKNIGLLDNKIKSELPRFDFTIAYNDKFKSIIAKSFGVADHKVILCPHPRIDSLSIKDSIGNLRLQPYKYLSVWLPTYRSSKFGDIRIDGDSKGDIFDSSLDLSDIDDLFRNENSVCIIKPHTMANANRSVFARYSNIIYVDDDQLSELGITLYQLLGNSHFLITDVSSIYFDYKLLGRPIVICCPDFLSYKDNRGFVDLIDQLIEQNVITEHGNFLAACRQILKENISLESKKFNATGQLLSKLGVI
jgi:CDP-glycerol glycerophosphotransferase (TagB/SpsB family)